MEADKDRPTLKLSRYSRKKPVKRPAAETKANPERLPKRRRKKTSVPIPSFSPIDSLKDFDASILDTPPDKKKKLELDASILDTPPTKKPVPIVWDVNDDDDDDDDDLPPPAFGTSQNIKVPEKKSSVRQVSVESDERESAELPLELVQMVDSLIKDVVGSKVTLPEIVDMVEYGDNKALRNQVCAHIESRMEIDDSSVAKNSATKEVPSRKPNYAVPKDRAQKEVVFRNQKETVAKGPVTKEIVSQKVRETVAKLPAAKEVVSSKAKETIKPENDALLFSVDCLFVKVDAASTTIKDFMISLEAEYGAKLHKDSRAMVKAHLKALFSGDVEPRASLPSSAALQHVAMEEASLKSTSYEHKKKEAVSVEEESSNDTYVFDVDHVDESGHHSGKAKAPLAEPEKQRVQLPEPGKTKTQKRNRPRKNVNSDHLLTELPNHCSPTRCTSREPPDKKPKAPTWPRTKKGNCALCTTCICTIGKHAHTEQTPGGMPRTDAEIERALIRRAKKLEDIVDKYENALDLVKRELKKHRRLIWKKQEAHVNDGKQLAFGDSRFLPDVDVWDEQAQTVQQEALPRSVVYEAQGTVFGGYRQPTLTQMFGSGSGNDDDDAGVRTGLTDTLVDAENDATVFDLCSSTVTDEITTDALGVTEAVEDYADIDPETGPVDHVHRLTWREGVREMAQSPLLRGSGVWSALTIKSWSTNMKTSDCLPSFQHDYVASPLRRSNDLLRSTANDDKYICAWDALFLDHIANDDGGMTQLLDLFQTEMADGDAVSAESMTEELASSQTSLVETLVLTQRGLSLVEAIDDKITSDPVRLQAVEALCPNWRDSIRYALAQREEDEVRDALDRVQRSIENLNGMKEKIPTLLKRQELVLQLFEMSLTESLTRLEASVGSNNNCDED